MSPTGSAPTLGEARGLQPQNAARMKIAVDGADLDVADDGRGEAIVFLHAFALSKAIWDEQAAQLAKRGRVVRMDLRGMGASSSPPGPYLTESLASDISGVLDALDIETAAIVGHSYSVGIAIEFYRMFAERVTALALVCGSAAAPDSAAVAEYSAGADAIERGGMQVRVDASGERYLGKTTHRERPDIWGRVRELLLATSVAGAAATLRGRALRGSSEDLLAEIGVPVAVVAGREDEFASVEAMRALANALPNATFDTLECGHVPSLEAPEATTAILENLMVRVPSFETDDGR